MKNNTGKKRKWLTYLIISLASFVISMVFIFLADALQIDVFYEVPRFIDKLAAVITYGMLTVSMLSFAAAIVYLIRSLTERATSKYVPPETSARKSNRKPQKVDRRALYDTDDVMQLGKGSQPMTWLYVGLFLCSLFPVGIFFLVRKMIEEKTRYYENGIRLTIFGGVVMALAVPALVIFFTQDTFETISILFAVPFSIGFLMVVSGLYFKHKGRINHDYMTILKIDRITRLDKIAQIMKTDYAHSEDVVQKLIDNNLLRDAYIYHRDKEVIIPDVSEKIAIKCRCCAATTVLYSQDERKCVYCGERL